MKEQVFISYSWVDAPVVKSITEQLRSDSYVPWIDREHLDLNGNLRKQIKEGICSSDYFVLIYSSESVLQKSTWVEFEIETAKKFLAEERILRLDIDKKKVISTSVASNKAFMHTLYNVLPSEMKDGKMQTPEAREEYIRKAVWDGMLGADFNTRYWSHLIRRYSKRDKYTKIFLAIISSSTVASWGFWDEIDLLWKSLSAISAFIALALPILDWPKTISRMSDLAGKWSRIEYEYENLWLRLQGDTPIDGVEDEYKRIRGEVAGLDDRGLPEDVKLKQQCRDEVLKSRDLTS